MTCSLEFIPIAKKEWDKLGFTIKEQFKKKLSERLKSPHVPKDAVNGGNNLYKTRIAKKRITRRSNCNFIQR